MKKVLGFLVAIITCFSILAGVFQTPVFANSCAGAPTSIINCDDSDDGIQHILTQVIDILTAVVGVIGVLGIVIVGIQYLTAGGNEEQTRKAKRRIFEIVIGLVAYILIYAFLRFLLPTFAG